MNQEQINKVLSELDLGVFLQYCKGEKMNEVVEVKNVKPLDQTPWSEYPLIELSDGESIFANFIAPHDIRNPFEQGSEYNLIVIPSQNNKWKFQENVLNIIPENLDEFKTVVDREGKTHTILNPMYVPPHLRTGTPTIIGRPSIDDKTIIEKSKYAQDRFYEEPKEEVIEETKDDTKDKTKEELEAIDIPFQLDTEYINTEFIPSYKFSSYIPSKNLEETQRKDAIELILSPTKKENFGITFDFNVDLPNIDILHLIQDQYDEKYFETAIDNIMNKIDIKTLIKQLRESITQLYKKKDKTKKIEKTENQVDDKNQKEEDVKVGVKPKRRYTKKTTITSKTSKGKKSNTKTKPRVESKEEVLVKKEVKENVDVSAQEDTKKKKVGRPKKISKTSKTNNPIENVEGEVKEVNTKTSTFSIEDIRNLPSEEDRLNLL